jgi:hypothetical protein
MHQSPDSNQIGEHQPACWARALRAGIGGFALVTALGTFVHRLPLAPKKGRNIITLRLLPPISAAVLHACTITAHIKVNCHNGYLVT